MTSDGANLTKSLGVAPVEFLEVDPFEERDRIVEFFWEQQYWPGDSIEEYFAMWDWRYTSLSDGDPIVFVARVRESGKIVGHIAAYPRRFRIGDHEIRAAVLGNLVLDPEYRVLMVGPRMLAFPATLVKRKQFDLVIAFANDTAHAGFLRVGFRDLGFMHSFVDPRRSSPFFRRRFSFFPALATLPGKLIDTAFALRRAYYGKASRRLRQGFRIAELSAGEFERYTTAHWDANDDSVASADRASYVVRRYLTCPYLSRRLFGVFDTQDRLQGYLVTEGDNRLKIWDCQVNYAALSATAAIRLLGDSLPDLEIIIVPTLPESELAAELRSEGFIERPPFDYIERTTPIAAYWARDCQHAVRLADPRSWRLWFGSNHY